MILPSVAVQRDQRLDLATAARHAEDCGLASVWHGDHLALGSPTLDCAVALAVAAAVTTRVRIGASVFVPAIRPLAWAAKQVASLQHVAAGRVVLGIGSGGGEEQWAAAGVPYAERGARTDTALARLPHLLADPPVERPPFWVGNASAVALRRAARYGDGWFPSLVAPSALVVGVRRLGELAAGHGRSVPTVAIGATGALGPGVPSRREIAEGVAAVYGRPVDEVGSVPLSGSPQQVAEQLVAYREAGAAHAVVGVAGGDWREQCALLAAAAEMSGV